MSLWPELPEGVGFPPFACIPGKTARHPEDWFDPVKASVTPDIATADLPQTVAFRTGLAYFGAGYFWECHEVLEAVWMATKDPSPARDMVQALIQLANARLKLRMERPRAAHRLCDIVADHLARCPQDLPTLGVRISDVCLELENVRHEVNSAL